MCAPGTVPVMLLYMKMYPFVRIVNVLMRKNCVMIVSIQSVFNLCLCVAVCVSAEQVVIVMTVFHLCVTDK